MNRRYRTGHPTKNAGLGALLLTAASIAIVMTCALPSSPRPDASGAQLGVTRPHGFGLQDTVGKTVTFSIIHTVSVWLDSVLVIIQDSATLHEDTLRFRSFPSDTTILEYTPNIQGTKIFAVTAIYRDGTTQTTEIMFSVVERPAAIDATLPVVRIHMPADSGSMHVNAMPLTVSGIASDNTGVSRVEYILLTATSRSSAVAQGTNSWSVPDLSLGEGETMVIVQAMDDSGNIGTDTIRILYTAPASTHRLTVSAGANGSVIPAQPVMVETGVNVNITATPELGYAFAGWSAVLGSVDFADSLSAATDVRLISGDATISAAFVRSSFTLNIPAGVNGTIVFAPNKTTFMHNEMVNLRARPGTGYYFGGWGGDTSGTDTSITITMTRNRTISATFARIGSLAITITAVNGTISKFPDTSSYQHGDQVTLTAVPREGYRFVGWSGDTTGNTNPLLAMMYRNMNVAAIFIRQYELTITTSGLGTITGTPAGALIDSGQSLTLTANPGNGFRVQWGGDATGADNGTAASILMNANKSITATFIRQFTLTLSADPVAGWTVPAPATVDSGVRTQIHCAPESGHGFSRWIVTSGTARIAEPTLPSTTVELSSNAVITANLIHYVAPTIVQHPGGPPSCRVGDTVALFVVATGVPTPTYQWYRNGSILNGKTDSVLVIPNVQRSDSGSYSVYVNNLLQSVPSLRAFVNVSYVKSIAAGALQTFFVRNDGTLWGCGDDDNGQLGYDGSTLSRSSDLIEIRPGGVSGGIEEISAGYGHTVIRKADGTIWVCGLNENGQLGTDGAAVQYTLTKLSGMDRVTISAGGHHTFFMNEWSYLFACGRNDYGQLGLGDTVTRWNPQNSVTDNILAVSGGLYHSVFVKVGGSLWACGYNSHGQLGDSTALDRLSPVQIIPAGVAAVAAGAYHTMILKNGTVLACGANDNGQLGAGTFYTNIAFPVTAPEWGSVSTIAVGHYHTMALKKDGTLWGSGNNNFGQLGVDLSILKVPSPVECRPGGISGGVMAVAAGIYHTVILKTDGTLWTCGRNNHGQIGYGTPAQASANPAPVRIY